MHLLIQQARDNYFYNGDRAHLIKFTTCTLENVSKAGRIKLEVK